MILSPLYSSELIKKGLRDDPRVLGGNLTHSDPLQVAGGATPSPYAAQFVRASRTYALSDLIDMTQPINVIGDRTVTAWVSLTTLPSTGEYYAINAIWESGQCQNWILMAQNVSGSYYFAVLKGNRTSGSGPYQWQRWAWAGAAVDTPTHVAWTWTTVGTQSTQHELWINGVSQGNGTIVVAGTVSTTYVQSGRYTIGEWATNTTTQGPMNGIIDDVQVWSGILSGATIAANMSTERVGDEAGLVGYHKINNNWLDSTVNALTLTPSSPAPTFAAPGLF